MIQRQKLKCPLLTMLLLISLTLVIQIAIVIMQPLANWIGYDWSAKNQNIGPNDANNDGIIKCPDPYLEGKVSRSRYIYSAAYSMMLVSFVCVILAFVLLLVAVSLFLGRSEKILAKEENKPQFLRTGSLKGLYDQFFTNKLLIILYMLISVAVLGQLINFGACASMTAVYANCESTNSGSLLAIMVLGIVSFLLLVGIWLILFRLKNYIHEYKNRNSDTSSSTSQTQQADNGQQGKQHTASRSMSKKAVSYSSLSRKKSVNSIGIAKIIDDVPDSSNRLQLKNTGESEHFNELRQKQESSRKNKEQAIFKKIEAQEEIPAVRNITNEEPSLDNAIRSKRIQPNFLKIESRKGSKIEGGERDPYLTLDIPRLRAETFVEDQKLKIKRNDETAARLRSRLSKSKIKYSEYIKNVSKPQ